MLMRFFSAPELGRRGEQHAASFYNLRGYRVIARNVRVYGGELDLIVRRGNMLVFVEVKTRATTTAGAGLDSVTPQKQLQIMRLAERWLAQHPHDGPIRYDVVSLHWDGRGYAATHVADAFEDVAAA